MAKSRRVRRNPTGTLLVNPRGKGKKSRRVRKNGGSFSKLLSRLTGRGKARKGKRKNPLAVNPRLRRVKRRNPLAVNPRHRKNKVRRHRKNPLAVNPIRIRRRRKNPATEMLGGVHKSAMGVLGKIPLIGGFLAATLGGAGAVLSGAIGVLPTAHLLPYVSKWIPDMVKPFAYSAGGMILAGGVQLLPAFPFKKELQIGLAASGGAVDTFRWRTGKSHDIGEFSSLLSGDGDMGDIGDELSAEELGEELDAMGVDDLGAPGAAIEWADAGLGDADYCGSDLSADEVQAAALGRRHYYATYGDLEGDDLGDDLGKRAVRSGSKRRGVSRHAGKPGGRWGWLIMWIGMDNFQNLAKKPAPERAALIGQLKERSRHMAARLLANNQEPTMENAELAGLLVA